MKVVFVHPSYPNQFTAIAHSLAEDDGWQCSFLVNEGFTADVQRDDPPIPYYGFREEADNLSGSYYIRSIEEGVRRGKAVVEALMHIKAATGVDLVVGHASFGATFHIRELLKIPVVSYVELPGYYPVYCRKEFPAQYSQALMDVSLKALIHSSVLCSDLCIVPSSYAKRLFPKDLAHKIRVQMEGFDVTPPVSSRTDLRRELGLPEGVPVVGFAGRTLESVRGFDIFVRAAMEIKKTRSDAHFLVLGDEGTLYGNESIYLGDKSFKRYALESAGADENGFIFRPFMPHGDFTRNLQAMDLVMFPLFEGAANWGLFEAMAAGIPVLASNRCFIPEVIRHGREGFLLEADDVHGFAEAALKVLAEPDRYSHLGRNARNRIAHRYSLSRARDGYAAILKEAMLKCVT